MKPENFYHYAECGLDYIYLQNGYTYHNTSYGTGTSIHDVDGLHEAIGLLLANQKGQLSGKEIRFLRHELDLPQRTLAELLGTTEQTFARWEKEKTKINATAQALLTALYKETIHGDGLLKEHLEALAELDAETHSEMCLSLSEDEVWERCVA